MKTPLILIFIAFVFQSCNFETFNGPVTQKERTVGEYESIHIKNAIDVILDPVLGSDIRISAPQDALEHIQTEIQGNQLIIDLDVNAILKDNPIEVTIGESRLNAVRVSGSGSFTGDLDAKRSLDLTIAGSGDITAKAEVERLKVRVSGSGDITCDGSADEVDVRVEGSGDVDLRSMEANRASAFVSGSGDIDLYVKESLEAGISGSGDITYSGNPEHVDQSVSGSGDIRSR